MNEPNPYRPSLDDSTRPSIQLRKTITFLVHYLVAYIAGIVACVITTPAETELAGLTMWPLYLFLAPIGVALFYLYLSGAYLPYGGNGLGYWIICSLGLVPIVGESLARLAAIRWLRVLRPWWTAFPIGFVGTAGVYFSAAASI